MSQQEEKNLHISDGEEKKTGKKSSSGVFIIGGLVAVVVAAIAGYSIVSSMKQGDDGYRPTADDLKQIEYDSKQAERDQQRINQIADAPFVMRDDQQRESANAPLFKGFSLPKEIPAAVEADEDKRQFKAEEEAIESVLRSTPPKANREPQPKAYAPPTANTANDRAGNSSASMPMFVYSRDFGGAKYVEKQATVKAEEKTNPADDLMTRAMLGMLSATGESASQNSNAPEPIQTAEKKTQLIYSGLTPVTVHEGEMLEAVLVNRLIVNTEASPVVCTLSRDVFDKSGQYVVFPANSRVIGSAQAVNYKGASRLFIGFHRIILPNGLSVDLPQSQKVMRALDETGALGVVSNVNRHWMLQFGAAIMLGVIDGIAGYAQRGQADTANGMVINRTSENFDRVLDKVMSQYSSIVPTISVFQGKTLRIYISDDMVISPYARLADRSYYGAR
jgi:type IV secretion system protein VirB10